MTRFASADDPYPMVSLADTDKPLPKRLDAHTRYAYFKTIARGGSSIIQSCKDLRMMRILCYKSLKPEFADDPVEQRRFVREARVSAMLQHPNTVPTYDLGRDLQGHCYFTMKLVHGYTLREILEYRERYDFARLIEVVIQVAHALGYAHNHGVAHRDIKPENVLVGPFGEVLLLDWGLAKVWQTPAASGPSAPVPDDAGKRAAPSESDLSLTSDGKPQGTVSYMSPEQIRDDPAIDYRTDIYSLGAVLYEILAGRPPFEGESFDEILDKTLNADLVPPSERSGLPAPVPERLQALCLRCLSRSPERRIQTAEELIRELQEDW